jgi:transglycosylase-like protein
MSRGLTIAAVAAGLLPAAVGLSTMAPGASGATEISPHLHRAISSLVSVQRRELRQAENSREVLGVPRAQLESIASCESGGNPRSVSSDGTYRGKYQFDRGTWSSVGGHGDPAAAPELEQDMRAAQLLKLSGPGRWPVCG